MSAPASLAERVEFLLWEPPEASTTCQHEVIPDANVDLLLELSDERCRAVLYGPLTRSIHVPCVPREPARLGGEPLPCPVHAPPRGLA